MAWYLKCHRFAKTNIRNNVSESFKEGITSSKEAGWNFTFNSWASSWVKSDANLGLVLLIPLVPVESNLGKDDRENFVTCENIFTVQSIK